MTLLTLSLAALALSSPAPPCAFVRSGITESRVFTNADLERMSQCRYQTGAQSQVATAPPEHERRKPSAPPEATRPPRDLAPAASEAHWRAQWRSVDQKARRLRRSALELRHEAELTPQGAKKQPSPRRSPSFLVGRALALEAEAKALEDEFEERARREGALPGWLRPRSR